MTDIVDGIERILDENMEGRIPENITYEATMRAKYEVLGLTMLTETNTLNVRTGAVKTTSFLEAIIRAIKLNNTYLCTTETYPLYNNANEYMGYVHNGETINIKNTLRNEKIIIAVRLAAMGLLGGIIGWHASNITLIAFILVMVILFSWIREIGTNKK